MRGLILVLTLLSVLPSSRRLSAQAAKPDSFRIRALAILRTVPLIDGHNDIPDAIRERGGLDSVDLSASQPKLMTDIPRMRAGGMGGQFWAAYVPVGTIHGEGPHPAVYALEQIDLVRRLCHRYPQALAMAATAADVERNFRAGKISCLIGIEGGHAIENSLGALRMFYALGVRYVTLTHWETIDWADAATDSAKHGGLTPFGEDVVREMNRLGMLVDLSHVSDSTMIDALRVSRAPVIFSHSSARALDSHVRNVPDSILRLLARNGGRCGRTATRSPRASPGCAPPVSTRPPFAIPCARGATAPPRRRSLRWPTTWSTCGRWPAWTTSASARISTGSRVCRWGSRTCRSSPISSRSCCGAGGRRRTSGRWRG